MKFKGRYRIESARLRSWYYASPGWYFVAICTKDKEPFFGEVNRGEMCLSAAGEMATEEWIKTEKIRSNGRLDGWITMLNHTHGILVIVKWLTKVETPRRGVSTTSNWKPGTLGSIIKQFKSISTKRIRRAGTTAFAWQPRFHDHIIRDEDSLARI